MLLIQTTGSSWDLRSLFEMPAIKAVLRFMAAGLIALVLYLRHRDRRRKLARHPKVGP